MTGEKTFDMLAEIAKLSKRIEDMRTGDQRLKQLIGVLSLQVVDLAKQVAQIETQEQPWPEEEPEDDCVCDDCRAREFVEHYVIHNAPRPSELREWNLTPAKAAGDTVALAIECWRQVEAQLNETMCEGLE